MAPDSYLLWQAASATISGEGETVPESSGVVERHLDKMPSWLIGALLVCLGALALWIGHACWARPYEPEFVSAFGEALVIAGLLSWLVDPFLKRRLLREAAKNIYVHMIGFDHEPGLKKKLEDIVFKTAPLRKV